MPAHDCLYVTRGWGVHDERWVAALRELGFAPRTVSLGRDAHEDGDLRDRVLRLSDAGTPVLAGPLHAVTRPLVGLPIRLVGLSWGYDLEQLDRAGGNLAWLATLDGLVVDSVTNRTIAERAGLGTERITFLPWGVDIGRFTPDGPAVSRADLNLPGPGRVALSLRAHESIYRVPDVIDAVALLDDVALVIGHSGSLTDDLRAQVTHLDLADRVRFIGTVPEADIPALMRMADCYVTASEVDGTSVTLLQAMACGTAVVASDTPGNRQWVHAGSTGWSFPTGDSRALARAMSDALTSDSTQIVAQARALVERDADWHANLPRLRAAMDRARAQ